MSTTDRLLKTALHARHVGDGGRMVDFAGWLMPVQYASIIDEHNATRNAAGLFDVSHMGRFYFRGQRIDSALDRLTTRRVAGIEPGKICYSLVTNEAGFILDDILVYRLPDSRSGDFMMVVNASNRDKILSWLQQHLADTSIEIDDRTTDTVMIACQGPSANEIVGDIADIDPATLKYYSVAHAKICGADGLISRTGYTGEDGCEIIVDNENGVEVWEELCSRATAIRGGACGLASRDTLRLEAAMPLYGHELGEDINAAQTGLSFAINLKDRDFVGRSAIVAAKRSETLPVRIGMELEGRRAARQDCPIRMADRVVGHVTSGTFSPTLQTSISMGYVEPQYAEIGTELTIDIRGKDHCAKVMSLPFYRRT